MKQLARASFVVACLLAGGGAPAAGAHVHGVASLSVSVEGASLRVLLEAPLEVVAGFEHAPRTAAERQVLQAARAALAQPALLQPNAEAGCVALPAAAPEGSLGPAGQGHADLEHEFGFRCTRPARLRSLQLGLFDAFPRLRRIEAVVVTPSAQVKRGLQRPQRQLPLAR